MGEFSIGSNSLSGHLLFCHTNSGVSAVTNCLAQKHPCSSAQGVCSAEPACDAHCPPACAPNAGGLQLWVCCWMLPSVVAQWSSHHTRSLRFLSEASVLDCCLQGALPHCCWCSCRRWDELRAAWIFSSSWVASFHPDCFLHSSDLSCLFLWYQGEDPLAGDQNDHDMDSIAGVLKLYFRGLEHPLFPKDIFHDLIACVSKYRYRNEQIVKAESWICLR